MNRLGSEAIEAAKKRLEKAMIFTVDEAASVLGCSVSNARLKIKQWKAYTSYNGNGRYYAMPKVPKFDGNGLWRHEVASFSRHGNLKSSVVHLVVASKAGLTGRRLGELLGMSPQSFVHHVRGYPGIRREKREGVFVYFSEDDAEYEKQSRRRASVASESVSAGVSDLDAVAILVAVVKRRGITAEEIAGLPEMRKRGMKSADIRSFMRAHDLEKKIPDSRP
jgi:hypothetical protein